MKKIKYQKNKILLFILLILFLSLSKCLLSQQQQKQQSQKLISDKDIIKLPFVQNKRLPFQGKIWIYWNQNIQKSPLIVQLCYQKLKRSANKQKWNLTLLSDKNLHNYISNYEYVEQVITKGTRQGPTAKSDLIRITILEQHGGVWFDISTVLLNGFEWLKNLGQDYSRFIFNKYGNNSNDPDVFFFTQTYYQTANWYRTSDRRLITQFPGYAIWFVAAKKKAKLMTEWKLKFYQIHQRKFQDYMTDFHKDGIFLKSQAVSLGYFSGNLALLYVIQQKQKQFDTNLTLFTEINKRKNVFQHYKIWTIQGQIGPLLLSQVKKIFWQNPLQLTRSQLQQITGQIYFFVKLNSQTRPVIEDFLTQINKIFYQQKLTFKQYLSSYVKPQDCYNIHFIVKDSLFEEAFKQIVLNINGSEYKIPTITLQQRKQWQNYCSQNSYKFFIQFLKKIGRKIWTLQDGTGQYCKVEEMIAFDKNLTNLEYLKVLIQGNQIIIARAIFVPLVILLFYLLSKFFMRKIMCMIAFMYNKLVEQSSNYPNQKKDWYLRSNKQQSLTLWLQIKSSFSFLNISTLLSLLSISLSIVFYIRIDRLFGGPQPYQSLIYALIILFIKSLNYCIKSCNHQQNYSLIKMRITQYQLNYLTKIINNFFLTYNVFSSIQYSLGKLSHQSVIVGLAMPVTFILLQSSLRNYYKQRYSNYQNYSYKGYQQKGEKNQENIKNYFLLFLLKIIQFTYQIFPYVILIAVNMLPNLKYIRSVNSNGLSHIQIFFQQFIILTVILILLSSLTLLIIFIITKNKKYHSIKILIYQLFNLLFIYQSYYVQQEKYLELYKNLQRPWFYYTLIGIWLIIGLQGKLGLIQYYEQFYQNSDKNNRKQKQKQVSGNSITIQNIPIINSEQLPLKKKILFQFGLFYTLLIFLFFLGVNYSRIDHYSQYQTIFGLILIIININYILGYNKLLKYSFYGLINNDIQYLHHQNMSNRSLQLFQKDSEEILQQQSKNFQ